MLKRPVYSIVRAQVVALSDTGLSQVQISRHLNISGHCVQNAIEKYNETDRYNDLQRTSCPKKIEIRNIRHLKRLVKVDVRLNVTKFASDLNGSLPKLVTTRTIRRYLGDLGFEYIVKIKKQ